MTAPERWFEDYPPGCVFEFGDEPITEAQIIAFASEFDAQPFHTDPGAAAQSIYGSLIASGWMTGCLLMRMLVQHYYSPLSSLGSPGLDELRWPLPVRPGDRLSARVTVIEARRSNSKPDRGLVSSRMEVLNQHGEVVMSMRAMNFIKLKPARTE